jgi:hypothetical protein
VTDGDAVDDAVGFGADDAAGETDFCVAADAVGFGAVVTDRAAVDVEAAADFGSAVVDFGPDVTDGAAADDAVGFGTADVEVEAAADFDFGSAVVVDAASFGADVAAADFGGADDDGMEYVSVRGDEGGEGGT